MAVSMYKFSIPVFRHFLGSHADVLGKAKAHCAANEIADQVLLQMRLHPTMLTMGQQTFRAATHACTAVARLGDIEMPSLPENSHSFDDLIALANQARDFAASATPEQINDSEDKIIEFQRRVGKTVLSGRDFLLLHIMPNFHFHITTGYDILRHAGVELGKIDFIGTLPTE